MTPEQSFDIAALKPVAQQIADPTSTLCNSFICSTMENAVHPAGIDPVYGGAQDGGLSGGLFSSAKP